MITRSEVQIMGCLHQVSFMNFLINQADAAVCKMLGQADILVWSTKKILNTLLMEQILMVINWEGIEFSAQACVCALKALKVA